MRHPDTARLREIMKGYTPQDPDDVPSDQEEKRPMPPLAVVRGGQRFGLPRNWPVGADFAHLVESRRSRRAFDGDPLTLDQLAFLLWAAQGVEKTSPGRTTRTVPSAVGRQALELYAFVNAVEGLEPGLYHYLALDHQLELVSRDEKQGDKLSQALLDQPFAGHAPVCLVWTAVPYRTEWRYDNKAQKYILLDAGHSCQNVYLACECLGLGCCAIAAYEQEKVDALLALPSGPSAAEDAEFAVYACCIGRPKQG